MRIVPVTDLLYGDYTYVNRPLAAHYGMPLPDGPADRWVRVDKAGRYQRGGLLPMAVFLTQSSPGQRTSPVKRGYWLARNVLGQHIPAPPPNVPAAAGERGGPRRVDAGADDGASSLRPELRVVPRDVRLLRPRIRRVWAGRRATRSRSRREARLSHERVSGWRGAVGSVRCSRLRPHGPPGRTSSTTSRAGS